MPSSENSEPAANASTDIAEQPRSRPKLRRRDEPKQLTVTPTQRRVIDHIEKTGDTVSAAARALNMPRSSVSRIVNLPHVMAEMQLRINQRIRHGSLVAIDTVSRLAQSGKSEYVKLQAAQDLLDRAGFKPPDQKLHRIEGDLSIHIDLS